MADFLTNTFKRGVLLTLIIWMLPVFAKYQVCSITINSSDEIETFKRYLPAKDFEFIELVPSNKNYDLDNPSNWFNKACNRDIKCDILVISGHFAGTFFGESQQTLPIELIEEKACQKSCGSILSQAKEIFLFGCNTLSDKKKDSRTQEQYFQILLNDGLAREHAERVVSSRYSPIEISFYDRMKFAFSGSNTIYGFDTVSPLGENIYPFLEQYFHSINKEFGSYASYLKKEEYNRSKNKELFASLSRTSLSQAQSGFTNEDSTNVFYHKCTIYDNKVSFSEKLKSVQSIFEEGYSDSAFFSIDYFLNQYGEEFKKGQGQDVFQSIKNNKNFKSNFESIYDKIQNLYYLRIVYLNILNRMEWISFENYILKVKENVLKLLENPNSETYEVLSLLKFSHQLPLRYLYLKEKDLPKPYPYDLWGLLILEQLKIKSSGMHSSILKSCRDKIDEDIVYCYQALNTIAHTGVTKEIVNELLPFLEHKDSGIIVYTLKVFGQSRSKDYFIHNKIASFIEHKDPFIQEEALKSLGFLKTSYSDIHYSIAELLNSSDRVWVIKILNILNQMTIEEKEVIETIIETLTKYKSDQEVAQSGMLIFKNSTHKLNYTTLDYFYTILESQNYDLKLFAISTLSYINIKDIGIFYRFVKLLQDPNPLFKKEAFKSLSHLSWFHPEIQKLMIPFLLDEDKEIRQLTVDIFRNVENWSENTYRNIKNLPNKNDEIDEVLEMVVTQLNYSD